ncbi:MAG: hypothetical protein KDI79_10165 [Anaerolineae bacterium]|nr:hypothetical protein [Anaerolineae bacterium]
MKRHLPGLVFLSSLALMSSILLVVPADDWLALFVYGPVVVLMAVLLYHKGIKPVDPDFPGALFALAFILKLLGSVARYWMAFDLYGGAADAGAYHQHGQYIAQYLSNFDFSVFSYYTVGGLGTTHLTLITGIIYAVLPASQAGLFFFFATLALAGCVLCYRAFRLGFPEVAPERYRLVIFFLPSILFWPSSVGKEAWLLFSSGLVAYGFAKLVRRNPVVGGAWVVTGLWAVFLIRPHFATLMVVAMGAAYLLTLPQIARKSPAVLLLGGALIVALAAFIVPSGGDYVGANEFSLDEFEARYEFYQGNTSQGGSSFQTYSLLNPIGWVLGPITVLFRPFPWEAGNPQMLVTALESFFWLGLAWRQRDVFRQRLGRLRSDPWLAFVALYTLVMILAFTTFGNFGILARQRTLLLPFFWMLFV